MNTLVKYNKHQSVFDKLTSEIFQDVFSDPFFAVSRNWALENNSETEKEYRIEVELPRFRKEEIKVTSANNSITIEAKNGRRSYFRTFETWDADTEKSDVQLENGVLTVVIPKKPESIPKQKVLEIKDKSKQLTA